MTLTKEEIIERLHQAPSEENLDLLPIFAGRRNDALSVDMLHKSYHPDVSVTNILFNNRASRILRKANIRTIGQLLLTSYSDLLSYRNCGLQTVEVFQTELRSYILDKKFDYSPYWESLETMLRNVIAVRERNFLILMYRLGIGMRVPYTLQKCGDKFGITREAVRQTLNQITDMMNHPEIEFKMRPFWTTVDKILRKREVMTSEELAKKLKDKLNWKVKPESHAMERLLMMKYEKYEVTNNHLVCLTTSKCYDCEKMRDMIGEVMGDKDEMFFDDVYDAFYQVFIKCCPAIKSYPKSMAESLVELHIQRNLDASDKFIRKSNIIYNASTIE